MSTCRRLAGQAFDGSAEGDMLSLQLHVLQDFCGLDTTFPKEAIPLLIELMRLVVPPPVLGALLQTNSAIHLITKRQILGPPHLARALICNRLEELQRTSHQPGAESCCASASEEAKAAPVADGKQSVEEGEDHLQDAKPWANSSAQNAKVAIKLRRYSYLAATLVLFSWGALLACFAAVDWAKGAPCIIASA